MHASYNAISTNMQWNGNGYNGYGLRTKPNLAQERHVHIQAVSNIERSTELCFDVKSMGTYQTKLNHGKARAIGGGDAVNACKLQCNVHYITMMHDNATIYDGA